MEKKEELCQNKLVLLKAVTWNKNSFGLFDYECKNNEIEKLSVEQNSFISRLGTRIQIYDEIPEKIKEEQQILAKITLENKAKIPQNSFYFTPLSYEDVLESPYVIVRSLKDAFGNKTGSKLNIGDVVKLGRMQYKILEAKQHFCEPESIIAPEKYYENVDEKAQCRVCLNTTNLPTNELINPCNCKGSCEFIHIDCLKQWINGKMNKKVSGSVVFHKTKCLECEICKTQIPIQVKCGGKIIDIIEIERPMECPYLIMETMDSNKLNCRYGIYIIYFFGNDTINIGRGHSCDIRISDVSVSRCHAFIKYDSDAFEFKIIDNNSKFGTLVKINDKLEITQNKIAVQVRLKLNFFKIGRTVITAYVSEKKKKNLSQDRTNELIEKNCSNLNA